MSAITRTSRSGRIARPAVRIGAVVALIAGMLALTGPAGAAASADPVAPAAAPTGNVVVDPDWQPQGGLAGWISSTLTQTDGKVVIGGYYESVGGVPRRGLARLNADGTVDPTFNAGAGLAGEESEYGNFVLVETLVAGPGGSILVVGAFSSFNGVPRNGILRLSAEGVLDPVFAPDLGAQGFEVSSVAVQPDGRTIIAGYALDSSSEFLVRLLPDGSPDPGFTPPAGLAGKVAVNADGSIMVAGSSLVRLRANGTFDPTFALGIWTWRPDGYGMGFTTVAVDAGRQVIVGGPFEAFNGVPLHGLARFHADGTLDADFTSGAGPGDPRPNQEAVTSAADIVGPSAASYPAGRSASYPAGRSPTWFQSDRSMAGFPSRRSSGSSMPTPAASIGASASPTSSSLPEVASVGEVKTLSDGRVLLAGNFTTYDGVVRDSLVRLNTDGSVDPGFAYVPPNGPDAPIDVRPATMNWYASSWLAPRPDGTIVVSSNPLIRIAADGSVGPWRGASAITSVGVDSVVFTVARDSAGRIVAGGQFTSVNGTAAGSITRFNADGTRDASFDAGAGATVDPEISWPLLYGLADVLALVPTLDGGVVVGGAFSRFDGVPRQGVVRLAADGSLDPTFHPGAEFEGIVTSLSQQPDGKLLVAGAFRFDADSPWVQLARLNPDGSRDGSFGAVVTDTSDPADIFIEILRPTTVLQGDGKVILGGTFTTANGVPRGGIVRLDQNGVVDATYDPGASSEWWVTALGMGADGSVIAGLFPFAEAGDARNMVRILPSGSIDPTFSVGSGFGTQRDLPVLVGAVSVAPDGTILVGGLFDVVQDVPRSGIARLLPSGALDPSFDPGSGLTTSDYLTLIAALTVAPDGKVIIGGNFVGFNGAFPAPAGITRLAPPVVVPTAPQGVSVANGDGQVALSFARPASFGGTPAVSYEYSVDGGPWLATDPVTVASPLVIGGLVNGVARQVRLRAVNAAGAGAASVPVEVRPVVAAATVFVPVAPARVVDSRVAFGGAGPIPAGSSRVASVAAVQAGGAPVVPTGAVAVAYNLTVPSPAGAGHVRVMPGDAVGLTSASAINFRARETIANAATVKISAGRTVKLYAASTVDVILDVVGYFVPVPAGGAGSAAAVPGAAGGAGRFTPVTPVRVYDAASDPAGLLAPGGSRLVSTALTQVAANAVVPAGASAVAYNITVVRPSVAGHLRVMPGDVAASAASVINWSRAGDVIANGSVVAVDDQRRIRVFNGSGAPVRFLVDVVGYYSASGQAFYPVDPVRVSDSRWVFGGAGAVPTGVEGTRTVGVAGIPGTGFTVTPSGASAVAYNLTAVNSTGPGHARVFPAGAVLVTASVINWPAAGYTRANASVVAVSAGREVKVYNGSTGPLDVLIDVNGYYK